MTYEDDIERTKETVIQIFREGLSQHLNRPFDAQRLLVIENQANQILQRLAIKYSLPVPEATVDKISETEVRVNIPPEFVMGLAYCFCRDGEEFQPVEITLADGSKAKIFINPSCIDKLADWKE